MTATAPVAAAVHRSRPEPTEQRRFHRVRRRSVGDVPPLNPRLQLVRAAITMLCVLSLGLVLHLAVTSRLQHRTAQERAYSTFRAQLAQGTAPAGPVDFENNVVELGAPVAYLEIPTIGLSEVVAQGTSATMLFDGPGHRRDTTLPGQIGVSILIGRRAAYGGPFGDIGELVADDLIIVTTGQGVFEYRVIGVRREGDQLPPALEPGSARLVLATADGRAFLPSGVLRVDADITSTPVGGQPRLVTDDTLPKEERLMAVDGSSLWVLVLWLQAMIVLSVAAVWGWHRWGRPQTWVAFGPPLALVGMATAGEIARLLPNLI